MKLSQPLSFLLLTAASGSAAGANAKLTTATGTTSEYEPNNAPRLTKTIRRNANNGNNVRKLSKSGGTDATEATGKSSKSGASDDGILEFLDPNGTNCPCFTTAMINEAWAAFQDQNPGATCVIDGDGTDFLEIVTENGFPPFEFIAEKVEDRRRLANRAHGRRSGIRRNLGIGDSTIGYCEVVKESDGFMDPARTTLSGSYKDYDPTYFPDCVAEIEMSDMYADCQPPCRGRC